MRPTKDTATDHDRHRDCAASETNPFFQEWTGAFRRSAVCPHRAGPFSARLRTGAGRARSRGGRHRRRRRSAELREHHRGARAQRQAARARRRCVPRAHRRAYQRCPAGDRARYRAASRPPLEPDLHERARCSAASTRSTASAMGSASTAEQARVLDRYHTRFRRAGALLDRGAKVRLAEIKERLATLGTSFQPERAGGRAGLHARARA